MGAQPRPPRCATSSRPRRAARSSLLAAAVAALLVGQLAVARLLRVRVDHQAVDPLGRRELSQDLRHWVNQGLMTFFFLVVGLEAKRELDLGSCASASGSRSRWWPRWAAWRFRCRSTSRSTPAASGAHGWGAAMSTDTAFALGVLALVAPSGTRLRVRLLTLAVVDDLVALLVIATVYTDHVSIVALDRGRRCCSRSCSRCASRRSHGACGPPPLSGWRSGSRSSSPASTP